MGAVLPAVPQAAVGIGTCQLLSLYYPRVWRNSWTLHEELVPDCWIECRDDGLVQNVNDLFFRKRRAAV